MKRKILTSFIVGVLSFILVGCANKTTTTISEKSEPDTPPAYSSDKDYKISNWCGVQSQVYSLNDDGSIDNTSKRNLTDEEYLEQYRYLKECGITITQPSLIETGMNNSLKQLEAAQKVGIKQIIIDYALINKLSMYYEDYSNEDIEYEEVVDSIRSYIAPYLEYESLYGFYIKDEPDASQFGLIGFAQNVIKEASGKEIYVNLFPVYGTNTQFGGITYKKYIQEFLKNVSTSYISYDNYPIKGDGIKTYLQTDFLYNMDYLKELAPDREIWTFLQCIKFGGSNRAIESKADLSFQAYSFMAYGGECIQWFTYWYPGLTHENFGMPMIDSLGNRTSVYYYVKELNEDIHYLDDYYNNFLWQGVMINNVNGGEGNFEYIEESCITSNVLKKYESEDDLLIGVFKDNDQRNGFMVVNFTDPGKNISNKTTLEFDGYKNVLIIKNGTSEAKRINDSKLTLDLLSGEGCFVIPY